MSGLLGFLKTATVEEVQKSARTGGGTKLQRNPTVTSPAVRVWKDGSVYPNTAAVNAFDLEYKKGVPVKTELKNALAEALPAGSAVVEPVYKTSFEFGKDGQGNGFDVIDSRAWPNFKGDGSLLFIAAVPRTEPKLDLFGIVRRDAETGEPTESVLDQGSKTYGTERLLPAIKEIYNVELTDEKKYVDLLILSEVEGVDINKTFSKPIILTPKVIARGKNEDKPSYEKRENVTVYAFVPLELIIAEPSAEVKQPAAELAV